MCRRSTVLLKTDPQGISPMNAAMAKWYGRQGPNVIPQELLTYVMGLSHHVLSCGQLASKNKSIKVVLQGAKFREMHEKFQESNSWGLNPGSFKHEAWGHDPLISSSVRLVICKKKLWWYWFPWPVEIYNIHSQWPASNKSFTYAKHCSKHLALIIWHNPQSKFVMWVLLFPLQTQKSEIREVRSFVQNLRTRREGAVIVAQTDWLWSPESILSYNTAQL